MDQIRIIDSHTGGEPTRVVLGPVPDLGGGSLSARREILAGQHDWLRRATVNEPRGGEHLVGALLLPPVQSEYAAGVVFFNNVGYLGMCVHGTIGVAVTLAHLGRIGLGRHVLETPVGLVTAELHADGSVSVTNVPCYRLYADVAVDLPGRGRFRGEVAWGGNWFFLCSDHGLVVTPAHLPALSECAGALRHALAAAGVTGVDGHEIDHIELFGPPSDPAVADSRNFVLCPGGAYDRSPCGTGTSAKLACLHAAGRLADGQVWRQESVVGSVFEGTVALVDGALVPTVRGRAWICGEGTLLLDPSDPFRTGWGA